MADNFGWVSILGDKIASVASEHNIGYRYWRAFRHRYRFPDVRKMIGWFKSSRFT